MVGEAQVRMIGDGSANGRGCRPSRRSDRRSGRRTDRCRATVPARRSRRGRNDVARIGFAGVGNMGGPMAARLVEAGHEVVAFDVSRACLDRAVGLGARAAGSAAEAADGAEAFVSMLPAGEHVRAVHDEALLDAVGAGALLIDCSTVDVETSRAVHALGAARGHATLDAPVSGGVAGAAAGTLTFMVGGASEAFERAGPAVRRDGREGRALRRSRQRPGGQAVQQHDARHPDGGRGRGLRAGRAARARRAIAVRGLEPGVRPVLGAHQLLPGARARRERPVERRLPPGLRHRADGQGHGACAGGGRADRGARGRRAPGGGALCGACGGGRGAGPTSRPSSRRCVGAGRGEGG